MFRKVLVANRGEIACRVLSTLRALGIPSVAVFHFVDRGAPHVAMADESVELTGSVPAAAYLDGAQVLEACRATGADALHPGYGFLSENAAFAEAVARAGVRFIGPPADVMRLMGDKIRSRELAASAGVPTSPSVVLDGTEGELERAEALGFPLLVKASAGGGGKGMKIARDASSLAASVALARSEAARYFGDGRVYAERLLERPRHIEVQVLGDGRGNVVHLGERECSIQRRYQKVIEESPASALPAALRERIIEAGVSVARAARYENAGTVELIVSEDGSFYFLEMNTRLQVEHPVTEMVTGIELVQAQLRIAAEGALPFTQEDVRWSGHAIECRVCAEEPERGFRPAIGRVGVLRLPRGEGVRVDSGVREGQAITPAFDSLLLKLIVHGQTRDEAASRMELALRELVLLGVPTNIDYLSRIIGNEAFRAGRLHTGFVEEHAAALAPAAASGSDRVAVLAAAALGDDAFERAASDVPEPYASIGAYRN
jgi:propionyl-CoA carboxylase alpha chain/3-methylcrotonyl-CoA carboxylase alpha subunit/acetyl-CoA/propionyl-CoA carboxylase biotin carboxyl carrier protein